MAKIVYDFVTKEKQEIEINDDALFKEIQEIEHKAHLNNRREKRRHTSFNTLEKYDLQPTDTPDLMHEIDKLKLHDAFAALGDTQKDLIRRVFFYGENASDIAREMGVDKSAISHRLERIYARLKKLLE